ncbi:conserved hypothetical protein [delta proteobacterium NaphS2]|nr:conserved hypothetical protein [delta proteobacterium NaphS2]
MFERLCARIHVGAEGVGMAPGAMEKAINHAKSKKQFESQLSAFQITRFKIAEMAIRIQAARNLVYEAASIATNRKIDHFKGSFFLKCAFNDLVIIGFYLWPKITVAK